MYYHITVQWLFNRVKLNVPINRAMETEIKFCGISNGQLFIDYFSTDFKN